MAEDLTQLQEMRDKAAAAGDQAAVDRYDQRIREAGGGSTWSDSFSEILPALGTGVQLNAESYAGLPGDVESLYRAGRRVSNKWGGASPEELAAQREADAAAQTMPTTEDVHQGVTQLAANMPAVVSAESGLGAYRAAMEPVEPWQPKTGLGRFLQTGVSMIGPGAIRHLGRNVIMPWLGSEIGAEVGATLGPEEEQLLSAGGGLGGGPLDEAGRRAATRQLSGGPLSDERVRRLQTLQQERIPVTGGQALDNMGLKKLEVGPFANRPAAIKDQQLRAYTNAALRRVDPNITIDIADDVTMTALQDRFGGDYDNLVRDNNGVFMDPGLQNDLINIGVAHERAMGGPVNDSVSHFYARIVDAAQQNGGVIPPDIFQQINSEMSQEIKRLRSSPQHGIMVQALREMRDGMYDSLTRNGQPQIAQRAQDLARSYRNFKIIEKSLVGASGETGLGFITPEKLGQAVRQAEDSASYTQGRGDFDDLVKAGAALTAMPNSQTAGGILPYMVGGALGGAVADAGRQALEGNPLTAGVTLATAAGGAAAPFATSSYVASRPVRTSIVNRATGTNPAFFSPMQMPPVFGMSQRGLDGPVPVEIPPQEDEKQSMLGNDYPVPVDLVDPADVLARRGLRYGRV